MTLKRGRTTGSSTGFTTSTAAKDTVSSSRRHRCALCLDRALEHDDSGAAAAMTSGSYVFTKLFRIRTLGGVLECSIDLLRALRARAGSVHRVFGQNDSQVRLDRTAASSVAASSTPEAKPSSSAVASGTGRASSRLQAIREKNKASHVFLFSVMMLYSGRPPR